MELWDNFFSILNHVIEAIAAGVESFCEEGDLLFESFLLFDGWNGHSTQNI